ncbi:MAG: membrane protein insertase YidC [Bacteroidales bacterium]|nr:membrane protein insertase YidC [Bacteroidales bacterium]
MNRDTIIGLGLIFVILIGYSIWMTPSEEEKEAARFRQDSIARVHRTQDSIALLRLLEQQHQDSINKLVQREAEAIQTSDTNIPGNVDRDKLGVFANSSVGDDEIYILENDKLRLSISAKGGKINAVRLNEFQTYDSLPLDLFNPEKTKFGLTFFASNRIINTDELFFQPVYSNEDQKLSMRLYTNAGESSFNTNSYIEFLYSLKEGEYMMDFDINFVRMTDYMDQGTNYLDLKWVTELQKLEKSTDRFNGPTIYYKYYQDDVDFLSEAKDDEEELTTRVQWISHKHRFFSSTLIAKDYFRNANVKAVTDEEREDPYSRTMESNIAIPFDLAEDSNIPMSFYFGPTKFKELRQYKMDLERQIPLGWSFFLMAWINRYAVIPVFNYLEGFGWNYGIIILVLTILLKIVLFPIAYKSYMSSAKMRVLKPEIEELGKKFPKKEDSMKKQQATMGLYKQAGVNPMAGCVPMLLQFPILIAMFRFFPAAFELRQQPFLWADDLSSYDSILSLPFEIPFYGDHVSLFTLLMTISTLIYTKINQDMMGTSQQAMPGMKTMMYLMPIMFLGIFNNYASGLSYYYFLANVITFAQMYLIRLTIDEDKIRKQIEINKKKPAKKKSSWQKRLEGAAKQRGKK